MSLRCPSPPLSLPVVARAAAAHPEVHAYRNWRGQVVSHLHVDVTTIVEIATPQGPFPTAHVIRDADIRDLVDLTTELRHVKTDPSVSRSGRWLVRAAPVGLRIPDVIPAMDTLMGRSVRIGQHSGRVAVTAVGMFAGGGGFATTQPTRMSLQVVVASVTARPRVVRGEIEVRDVLDLTVTIDHNVVDGAPAARFGAELRQLIENTTALRACR